ncbi:sensor histidine kinase [Streptococcus massiliensis]|uniref:histidine kinase n=1 Tax=Streptococcus massiliensis TaxID=313439 RepID=A0A380KXH0_9STRE|nr:HAMP domain-containing sensor histidine kinase [Streptococcus massiliensis]SUN75979.1 putative sensor histidine kinase [Streptococcus massiliensis]
MLNKLKKTWYADDFSYFIRYFGVFTLIFSAMTLIIIQIMRSSLYKTVDDNLHSLSQSPNAVLRLALERTTGYDQVKQREDDNQPPENVNLSSNTEAVLFDEKGEVLTNLNSFLNTSTIHFEKKYLNQIKTIQVKNPYGHKENYRAYFFDIDRGDTISGIQYAAIMVNINQLEQTSQNHEQVIAVVMVSFWFISIIASLYLARVSVKPLIESIQKQQSFVENASHELRTPLAVLQNRLETLFRKPEATILESSENIASSLEEVRNMRMLTTNLLNLARRDDGIKAEITEVDPLFFETTFANYAMIAAENGKIFRYESRIQQVIKTDSTLLKQLMTILFDNAVKYTDDDGEISFVVTANDRYLFMSVADNGPGIRTEDKKKIFDRFYRVDKARTRQKGGFGLGLSLAKQIADALKGTITVKDNRPKGTIFEVKVSIKTDSKNNKKKNNK